MAKIIWTNKSIKDFKIIHEYISNDSKLYASRFINRVSY